MATKRIDQFTTVTPDGTEFILVQNPTTLQYSKATATSVGSTGSGAVTSVAGRTGAVSLTKSDVGLSNVDNTADASKPVSTAQAAADALKANISGQVFTGAISATNLSGTNTGDETATTIKTKLGVTTLSGSNTGDQDLSGYATTTALTSGLATKANTTHTHAESDVTGLTSDLAAKQSTLVSGTNIKTVNGNSLLGSGNLTLSSGGSSTLAGDTDVAITSPANKDLLTYDTASSKWTNQPAGSVSVPDATTTSKGIVQLAGDLGGTAAAPTVTKTYTKTDVGLSNVDNTSDATKNSATAVLTNKDLTSATNTFPTFNQNTTGTAANVTGTVAIANGGTGVATLPTGILKGAGTGTITAVTAPTGAIMGTSDTQVITNKDLTSATNTFPTSLATLTGSQTLTNKTLTTPIISTITNTGTLTLPTATGTVALTSSNITGTAAGITGKTTPTGAIVGDTDTQTLTNKTISTGSTIDASVTVTEVLKKVYPVGSVYVNASSSTNPATLLGFGTWTVFGAGRVPISIGTDTQTFSFATTAVNTTTDIITVASNKVIYTGTPLVLTTTGTAPAGLTASTTYYAILQSSTTLKLAASQANAVAGIAIDITGTGTGTHTLTYTGTAVVAGDLPGEEKHALTVNEMPSHLHGSGLSNGTAGAFGLQSTATGTSNGTWNTASTGGSTASNVMQPSIPVYMWQRTV